VLRGSDTHPRAGFLRRRRDARKRRADDRRALRSEFELDRPRGLAALRAFATSVVEFERERIRSHTAPLRQPASPVRAATRSRATSR